MLPNLELYLLTHQDKLRETKRNHYLESLSPGLLGQWVQRMSQMRSLLFFW